MKNKVISKTDFVAKIHNGASIMIGGFMNIGTPEGIIDAMLKTDVKDLTIICNDAGLPGVGVGKLIDAGKVKKLIASHIGLNPTVNGEDLSIEVHFLDFDSDIYDTEITVSVIERIRDEQKFTSIDILKSQIQKDKNFAISYIEKIV